MWSFNVMGHTACILYSPSDSVTLCRIQERHDDEEEEDTSGAVPDRQQCQCCRPPLLPEPVGAPEGTRVLLAHIQDLIQVRLENAFGSSERAASQGRGQEFLP